MWELLAYNKKTRDSIYIPFLLFVLGVFILKREWTIYGALFFFSLVVVKTVHYSYFKVRLNPEKFTKFMLTEKVPISHDTCIYRFDLESANDVFSIPVGHHVACRVTIDGKEYIRYYTPLSPFERGHFDILVKTYFETGVVSKYFYGLQPGQEVEFKGPVGRMAYTSNMAAHVGMVAGGSGITPMLQVLKFLLLIDSEDKSEIKLLYANKTEEDILLKDELDELQEKFPNRFSVVYTVDKPLKSDSWEGEVGRVTKEMLAKYMPAAEPSSKILICGPPAMKTAVAEAVAELGFPKAKPPSQSADQVFIF